VRARDGLMLGIRRPLDGPVSEKLEDARNWCMHAMISHYDRSLGMSDARICPRPDPALARDITRIWEQVWKENSEGRTRIEGGGGAND